MGGNLSHQDWPPSQDDSKETSQSRAQHVWEHRDWMTTVLAARTGGRWDVAEELWSDLVATLLEKFEALDAVKQIRPWLHGLAVHKAADWVRGQQRHAQRFSPAGSELLAYDLVTSADLPPLESLLRDEKGADLRQTLAQLPVEDQEVLYLKYLHQWNYSQIGEHLSLTSHQVTNRLRVARQRLKLALLQSPLAEDYSTEYQLGIQGVKYD
ncbi:MAG: sigma-70 family RNA polymerase sigma factor [Planctomycetaceae bacterium]|nr:sigma-70 family RNA polymerase sigma factor [Planctomycetaceae bacterium]